MTSRTALGLLALGIVLCGTVAASEIVVARPNQPSRVTIVYWEKWTGSEGEEMRKTVDDFNKSQNHVFVRYLSISDVSNKTLLATAGGDPPDVAGVWADQVPQFADQHAALDLMPLAKEHGISRADYIGAYWDMLYYHGGLWALPSTPASTALHVNKDLVPKEYASPKTFPDTFDKFDALVSKLNKKEDGRMKVAGFMASEPGWWNWAWGYWFGGKLVDGDKLTIDSPENIKAFEWVAHFGKEMGSQPMQDFQSGFGNFASPQDAFMAGKVASELHGVYKANYIRLYKPDMHWFAMPFPHPAGRDDLRNRTVLGQDVLMIPAGAKHPREAFEFIRYVQRQDVMESLCMRHGKNSPLAKVSQNFLTHHPNPFIALFDKLARSPGAFYAPKIGILPQLSDEMNNVFSLVNSGQKTPKEALSDAEQRLNGEWKTYKEQVMDSQ